MAYEIETNLKATELRLGPPGSDESEKQSIPNFRRSKKRASPELSEESRSESNSCLSDEGNNAKDNAPPAKTQIVGWPPIRSCRKNSLQQMNNAAEGAGMYVKVSMDGAPYLRKIDLKTYETYLELLNALEDMFKFSIGKYPEREGYNGSGYVPTYEDKDGDWMLVGDVPWDTFISSCKRLRIMKGQKQED